MNKQNSIVDLLYDLCSSVYAVDMVESICSYEQWIAWLNWGEGCRCGVMNPQTLQFTSALWNFSAFFSSMILFYNFAALVKSLCSCPLSLAATAGCCFQRESSKESAAERHNYRPAGEHEWRKSHIFPSGVCGEQNRAESRVNIRLAFKGGHKHDSKWMLMLPRKCWMCK